MESLFPQSTFSLKHPHGTEKYHYTERCLILKHFEDASEIIKSKKMLWNSMICFKLYILLWLVASEESILAEGGIASNNTVGDK